MALFSPEGEAFPAARSAAADETWRMLAGLIEAARIVPQSLRAPPGSLPLTVIGGFLGAGKTTLLNRLLDGSHGLRLAVLVNDFGAINIDAELVRSRTPDTISLANGCACCSVAGDMTRTLVELAQRDPPPDAIVVEASGVADPRSLAQVALANPALRLDGLITVVDAETLLEHAAHAEYGPTFAAQVEAADVVILNKLDLVTASRHASVRAWLQARAPGRPIVDAVQADVPVPMLLGVHTDRALHDRAYAAVHRHRFYACSLTSRELVEEESFVATMDRLAPSIVRAKAILWLSSAPQRRTIYQRVGARWSFAPGEPWGDDEPRSSLVLIGGSPIPDDALGRSWTARPQARCNR